MKNIPPVLWVIIEKSINSVREEWNDCGNCSWMCIYYTKEETVTT